MRGIIHAAGYTCWIIKEIFAAGLDAVLKAFNPAAKIEPIVIYYPMRLRTDWEVFWFTTSITATPGTLSMGLRHPTEPGGPITLLVQAAFGSDPEDIIAGLANMEEHVRPSLRNSPIDPTTVTWEPYVDQGPTPDDDTVPPAERMS
ncbi:monovalent cation/H+ antiporter subunit E [Corynebacterium coyleae]|uniref:monovalent cation/H+ antiporter subunit E n=1 Tax=Corynebacterium coyleae TaxID=53374 RepID=UPI00254DAD6E|nr:monovalent cation/H+ antiporter subunit E [Corynebacterium coyleae]MDK8663862.1 monovalent cation/H+ antiporter subunit E [Corynebacterium coyleae]MDK8706817.1 monovalent cation/H+ antiporter subunit E [Corynebacterium coyleae]MDK8733664.1 monovalent cation/H+ antiporter subunit E [Corynebacterium coyleae]MDK8892860.1 monovalent cation/H+ antiporter subunit E [Corynebacterium coyleae]